MGNKLLIAVIVSVMSVCVFADSEMTKIDSLIEKIKKERMGLEVNELKKTKDPFYYDKEYAKERIKKLKKKRKGPYFRLYAILNNKAKINRKWYRLGDKISGYKLVKISQTKVKLRRGNRTVTLFIPRKNRKIKIRTN
ncbi:hypothetical protein [Nitrosophilus alvini]|uniref:hypothetical protein n=1 Tax=Nitrosophilus alvini TaxID=2714855 RepID=UPI00190D64ED|nr:hypothetical protein [Nitrosophilus alvini]